MRNEQANKHTLGTVLLAWHLVFNLLGTNIHCHNPASLSADFKFQFPSKYWNVFINLELKQTTGMHRSTSSQNGLPTMVRLKILCIRIVNDYLVNSWRLEITTCIAQTTLSSFLAFGPDSTFYGPDFYSVNCNSFSHKQVCFTFTKHLHAAMMPAHTLLHLREVGKETMLQDSNNGAEVGVEPTTSWSWVHFSYCAMVSITKDNLQSIYNSYTGCLHLINTESNHITSAWNWATPFEFHTPSVENLLYAFYRGIMIFKWISLLRGYCTSYPKKLQT